MLAVLVLPFPPRDVPRVVIGCFFRLLVHFLLSLSALPFVASIDIFFYSWVAISLMISLHGDRIRLGVLWCILRLALQNYSHLVRMPLRLILRLLALGWAKEV